MTVNKRKKNSRQHGHKTHGWGAKKKHRGKGHQGGAGMAGSGKRADSKKPSVWKDTEYFGKHGFISKTPKIKVKAINVDDLEHLISRFVAQKIARHENGFYIIELEKAGYNKLLGNGTISHKFKITTPFASKMAIEKVKNAGGEVVSQKIKE